MNCAAGDKMLSVIFPEISQELFFRVWINIFLFLPALHWPVAVRITNMLLFVHLRDA